jgi:hypothetical protein
VTEPVGHQFELEHDDPHCFACRRPIEINALVLIQRVEDTLVWWHQECAPAVPEERSKP